MVLERLNVQPEQSTVDWHGASGVRGPLIFLSAYSSTTSSMSATPGHPLRLVHRPPLLLVVLSSGIFI